MSLTTRFSQLPNTTEGQWVPFTLASGNNTVLTGVAGETIVCSHIIFTSASATALNVVIKSGTSAFSGTLTATAADLEYYHDPLVCGSGQSLVITSDGDGGGMAYCVQGINMGYIQNSGGGGSSFDVHTMSQYYEDFLTTSTAFRNAIFSSLQQGTGVLEPNAVGIASYIANSPVLVPLT